MSSLRYATTVPSPTLPGGAHAAVSGRADRLALPVSQRDPLRIYNLPNDEGGFRGIDHDTAQFAVACIQGWWEHLGRQRFAHVTGLRITAECGGSNGNRTRMWKAEL